MSRYIFRPRRVSRNLTAASILGALLVGMTAVPARSAIPGVGHGVLASAAGSHAWGWGANDEGQAAVPAGLRAIDLAAGLKHSVALTEQGSVAAWGRNDDGQTDVPAGATSGIVDVAAGANHSLALTVDGLVLAWGRNDSGQAQVPDGVDGAVDIAAGGAGSLASTASGEIVYWGDSTFGVAAVPAELAGTEVVDIEMGDGFAVALTADGRVVSWGRSDLAQTAVPKDLGPVKQIAAGVAHTVALTRDGQVRAWGGVKANASSQQQLSDRGNTVVPTNLGTVTSIGAGGYHSLAVTSSGDVRSWGWNRDGQTNVPSLADLGGRAVTIAGGEAHTLIAVVASAPVQRAVRVTEAASPPTTPRKDDLAPVPSMSGADEFTPGQEWRDTNGEIIQAHGGQVVPASDVAGNPLYYWFGEDRSHGYQPMPGVRGYSSSDLHSWRDEGVIMRSAESRAQLDDDPYFADLYANYTEIQKDAVFADLDSLGVLSPHGHGVVFERPKVMYNDLTAQWVMWIHTDGPTPTSGEGERYAKSTAGVAVSKTPFGPYRYIDSYRLNYTPADDPDNRAPWSLGMARDMNIFKDTDGTGYIVYSSEENQVMYVSRLNPTYTFLAVDPHDATEGVDFTRNFAGRWREGPVMFKRGDTYYLLTSGATGWNPNAAEYATASNPLGPWTVRGNPATSDPGGDPATTHRSQPTAVIPIDADRGKFIYMGDRWTPGRDVWPIPELATSPYVWLPLSIGQEGALQLPWRERWTLEDLTEAAPSVDVRWPARAVVGDLGSLPATASVSGPDGQSTVPISWDASSIETPGMRAVTGTVVVQGSPQEVSKTIAVIPRDLLYLVDAGADGTGDEYVSLRDAVAASGGWLRNSRADQSYGGDPEIGTWWGYKEGTSLSADEGAPAMDSSVRFARADAADRVVEYRFDGLEPGTYTVHLGLYDPWSAWTNQRTATISVNGSARGTASIGGQASVQAYAAEASGDGSLTVTLSPVAAGPNTDVSVSWLMISR